MTSTKKKKKKLSPRVIMNGGTQALKDFIFTTELRLIERKLLPIRNAAR